ncbi:hypothetical protein E2C01_027215 [Portunus trituberculatus]|uniref:Uncharacterized protein n=1 Tax=Portunus trituberculatus TaxID=210409 RepID=A0A5B7EKJ0_PORTR|nr:hypothetical protein [Portunus trituberculatus]
MGTAMPNLLSRTLLPHSAALTQALNCVIHIPVTPQTGWRGRHEVPIVNMVCTHRLPQALGSGQVVAGDPPPRSHCLSASTTFLISNVSTSETVLTLAARVTLETLHKTVACIVMAELS